MPSESHIAGTVKIDGVAAARDVVVIKDDPAGRQVIAEGTSAGDGTFDISYTDWTGPVIAIALDTYGQAWEAEAPLNAGTVVHPSTPNGYVYRVTSAGTTGATEPTWSTSGSVTDGSVTYEVVEYWRPQASGPLEGEVIVDPGPTYIQAPYWRFLVYDWPGGNPMQLTEITFQDEAAARTNAGGTASASSLYSGADPEDAFDDAATYFTWGSGAGIGEWLVYEHAEPVAVVTVEVTGSKFSYQQRTPTDFAIEYSDDGVTWTELSRHQTTWGSSQETQAFTVQSLE